MPPRHKRRRGHYSYGYGNDHVHAQSTSTFDGGGASARGDSSSGYPPAAFTRAYEAQLVRGGGRDEPRLIRWAGDEESEVWADRHDILHLLDALALDSASQSRHPPAPSDPGSPASYSSWSLASDTEDTFALSGDEAHAAHAAARRRVWVEGLREVRVKEREREEEEQQLEQEAAVQRVVNEPPTPEIMRLMEHTARALAASPNPAALEMRIVTRQAADPRFTFLRAGAESSAVWARVRAAAMVAAGKSMTGATIGGQSTPAQADSRGVTTVPRPSESHTATAVGLGGLGGYDSDSDGSHDGHAGGLPPQPEGSPPPPPPGSPPPSPPP